MELKAEIVTLTIDGLEVRVPKGTNLIEAAKTVGIEIPFYCYHRHLSVAGNCRMCQVEIEGMPKLTIACNTQVQEGMKVKTHRTSEAVAQAQAATLEFLLINHPLDCTVCDEAGHCKLQDYYYQYSARASRFVEDKVEQVKAQRIGPEIMYDGERCIVCTRCVRFCDEVTKTGELAVFERGDRSVIGVEPGTELDNPFSGCVVDLCPVGALTHARWRFNTRIWYTKEIDTVCPGCSTGCSAKVAVRDGEVVFVKGRLNSEVNKEWLCNEGRYGFSSFQPERRLLSPLRRQGFALEEAPMREILNEAAGLLGESQGDTAVFLSPRLTLEEIWTALRFCEQVLGIERQSPSIAMQCVRRKLSELESLLISPDYAPNVRAMELLGASPEGADWRESAEERYFQLLRQVKKGFPSRILLVGDGAIRDEDFDENLYEVLLNASCSISLGSRGLLEGEGEETDSVGAHQLCKILFPSRTVNEKSGVFVSCGLRLQRLNRLLDPPSGSLPEWQLLYSLAEACSVEVLSSKPSDERTLFLAMTREEPALSGLTLRALGEFGLDFQDRVSAQQEGGMR